MDKNGYPEELELKAIQEWDRNNFPGLMEFIESLWFEKEYGFCEVNEDEHNFELHTLGESGNEDIIRALEENIPFWVFCWVESRVGGHYKFNVQG